MSSPDAALSGECFIAGARVRGGGAAQRGFDPERGEALEPEFHDASAAQIQRACEAASAAAGDTAFGDPARRAALLDTLAERLAGVRETLVARAVRETALASARLNGELDRTTGQLRRFATVLRGGDWQDVRIAAGDREREPQARPDLRSLRVPTGPVAVFGASNFPLAFSVAGGDTAAALAAGCPVVVKAHPAHPGTSEITARCVAQALADEALPPGLFSLLVGAGHAVGTALVRDPRIAAVGFTGSRGGGIALMKCAAQRPVPIPVFAEMSSINPLLLFPEALRSRSASIAEGLLGSLTMGAGQFCTCPGVIVAIESDALEDFMKALRQRLPEQSAGTMLTPGIRAAYDAGVAALAARPGVEAIGSGPLAHRTADPGAPVHIFQTTAGHWLGDAALAQEIFGATALLVRCRSTSEFERVIDSFEGQLTASLQLDEGDHAFARAVLPALTSRVGRIVCNGFPTGVEVSSAMVHGGPFPATSDGRSTSVGDMAIERFLRPVCFQDVPEGLLPAALRRA